MVVITIKNIAHPQVWHGSWGEVTQNKSISFLSNHCSRQRHLNFTQRARTNWIRENQELQGKLLPLDFAKQISLIFFTRKATFLFHTFILNKLVTSAWIHPNCAQLKWSIAAISCSFMHVLSRWADLGIYPMPASLARSPPQSTYLHKKTAKHR